MLTTVIRRNGNPDDIQMTLKNITGEMWAIKNSDILIEDSWVEGLRKTKTPYVCLMEADCTLSGSYIASNLGLMTKDNHSKTKGTGGYLKRAMLSSCLGYKSFANRIYNYELELVRSSDGSVSVADWQIQPCRDKRSTTPYHVQVGFVPGAIIRISSIKDIIDSFDWQEPNLVKLSTRLSFYLWNTNRRIQINPNTTYVSNEPYLENPPAFKYDRPDKAFNIFVKQQI